MERKIFLASTSYDIPDLRPRLIRFLEEERNQHLIYYENLPVKEGLHPHDICLDAIIEYGCNTLLLIIDKRYGGLYSGEKYPEYNGKSITWAEACLAYDNDILVCPCIRQRVWDETDTYNKKTKKSKTFESEYVENAKIFDFINYIQSQKKING